MMTSCQYKIVGLARGEKKNTLLVTIFEMEHGKLCSLGINYVQAFIPLQFSNTEMLVYIFKLVEI